MIYLHRVARWFYLKQVPIISRLIEVIIFFLFNSRIPSDIEIGNNTEFAYQGLSTLLVKGTKIGNNCIIGMRVTTGRNFPYKDVPQIKDKVWIGANVVIIGPVIIEEEVIIAPNSLVNKSVPKGAIVAGNPAEIIGYVDDLDYDIFKNPKFKKGTKPFLN